MPTRCAAALLLVCFAASPASADFQVDDGSLSDWGITVGDGTTNWGAIPGPYDNISTPEWGGVTGMTEVSGFKFSYHVEDTDDSANVYGQVGPLYGGQRSDAEFLGVGFQDNKLVIGILTGQRSDLDPSLYAPGDVRILTTNGLFGIEVTGATYLLNGNGYTQGLLDHNEAQTPGSVWATAEGEWLGSLTPGLDVQFQATGSEAAGMAQYMTTRVGEQHTIYEFAIDLSVFGVANDILSVQWAPSCGNDLVVVNVPSELQPPNVPEPSTLALLGMGGFGMAVRSLRRRRAG